MATAPRITSPEVKTDVVIMDGGLNEAVSSIEMKPGELILCKNYYITEGSSGGYVSLSGYERFDGTPLASTVDGNEDDDAAREATRAAITEVPGEGSVLGVHIFKGNVYAFRNKVGGATAGMYVATVAGWQEIDTSTAPLSPDGSYQFVNYNFLAAPDSEVMIWVDGENQARMYNETLITVISTGMGALDKPNYLAIAGTRLFLAFDGGSLQYSNAGDPTDWVVGAGEIGIGYEITALDSSVGGTLIIFCNNSIKILEGVADQTPGNWFLKDYSNVVGAYKNTLQKIFDTLIFVNDFGATTLAGAQDFGDFAANSISEKIKNTLLKYRSIISASVAVRSLNQYRLFFSNGRGLVFSFFNKKLRGVTLIQYPVVVLHTTDGELADGSQAYFFSSSSGYVYKMDSGTSFDGATIESRLVTTYHHYKSPRNWKRFHRITLEIASLSEISFSVKPSFDYNLTGFPSGTQTGTIDVIGSGGIWGEDLWGQMVWSTSEATNRIFYDLFGIGSNLSVALSTSSKYNRPHTIQNLITDYVILGRQL